jgi:hypothetical protein
MATNYAHTRQSDRTRIRSASLPLLLVFLTILVSMAAVVVEALPSWKATKHLLSAFTRKKHQSYTPLLFFTVPPGLMPECDAVEKTVRQVEKELGVTVQRMDVLRNPENEAVLNLLSQHRTPPFLYHRESCQTVVFTPAAAAAPASRGGKAKSKQTRMPVAVDKERIRAWAKGRYLTKSSSMDMRSSAAAKNSPPPIVLQQEDSAMDQAELLEDMALTPEQLRGKRLMQERTDAKAKSAGKS